MNAKWKTMGSMHAGPATWTINGERVTVLGWGRAILLQVAHPLVAAGVAEHSTFRQSRVAPLGRLHATVRAMRAMSFGTLDQARRAAEGIKRIHDRVAGQLGERVGSYPPETRYSAHDPALLAWVQVTLLDSMPLVYERCVAPLSEEMRDAYCRESVRGAELLGLAAELVPVSYAETRAAIDSHLASGQLVVTDRARAVAADVLSPPFRRLAWPAARIYWLLTVGLLPPALREQYRLPWSAADARDLERWSARLRAFSRTAPAALRRWPEAR